MDQLVLSASALQAFSRCPASYRYGYEYENPQRATNDAVEWGLGFHKLAELSVKQGSLVEPPQDPTLLPLWQCVACYFDRYRPTGDTIMVEDPLYTELIKGVVTLRTTFDRVYTKGDWVVAIDYKTFGRMPTLDVDLDFQGRIYLAALRKLFPGKKVRLEYHNVRNEAPGTTKAGKTGGVWTEAECYSIVTLMAPDDELDRLWEEAKWTAEEILARREDGRWRRVGLKGSSPYSCHGCFQRFTCMQDLSFGTVGDLEPATGIMEVPAYEPRQYPQWDAGIQGLPFRRSLES